MVVSRPQWHWFLDNDPELPRKIDDSGNDIHLYIVA
jgi:hypothetical protein